MVQGVQEIRALRLSEYEYLWHGVPELGKNWVGIVAVTLRRVVSRNLSNEKAPAFREFHIENLTTQINCTGEKAE